jgi:thiol:disulfide interchange protein DsbC
MRKLIPVLLVLLFAFTASSISMGADKHDIKAHDCAKCHELKNEEAAAVLKDGIPNVAVLNVAQAPVKGLWEVFIQSGNRKGIVYIDYSKKTFFSGALIDLKEKNNLTEKKFQELNKIDISKIPLGDALVLGNKAAKYKVIVFTDPDCPYFAKLHEEMKKVLEKRKDIVFYMKLYPLPMHPDAYWKSKSIVCEKSMQMLEDNFAQKQIRKTECASTAVDDNMKLAGELGISGTPALVLADGGLFPGVREADALIELITSK